MEGTDGLRYHASIPLYAHSKKVGVLNVGSVEWRELSTEDLRLLNTVGDLTSIAIERARLYEKSVETGAADERLRLAREIHDTLGQNLAAILMRLETLDALLESDTDREKLSATVRDAMAMARGNLEDARRAVLDLRAAPLENLTLAEALEALFAGIRSAQRPGYAHKMRWRTSPVREGRSRFVSHGGGGAEQCRGACRCNEGPG